MFIYVLVTKSKKPFVSLDLIFTDFTDVEGNFFLYYYELNLLNLGFLSTSVNDLLNCEKSL